MIGQLTEKLEAPWTTDQVLALNRWQRRSDVHPFTCGNDHPGDRTLYAMPDGWHCSRCDYRQTWAHPFMVVQR